MRAMLALVLAEGIRVVAGGDVTFGTRVGQDIPQNPHTLIKELSPLFQQADVAFVNLEGAISDRAASAKQGCGQCYSFIMPSTTAAVLASMGVDVVSLANNHARDGGQVGLDDTREALAGADIRWAGPLGDEDPVWTVEGVRVGLAAFSANQGVADVRDLDGARMRIAALAARTDITLVSFHAGAEGRGFTRTPAGQERYLGENRGDVRRFARMAVEAGADLLLGHGPHVPRAMEVYQGRLIAYSLGNLMTYGPFRLDGALGLAPVLDVRLAADGALLDARIHSGTQMPRQGWRNDTEGQAEQLMAGLSEEDFPDTGWAPMGETGSPAWAASAMMEQ